MKIKSVMFVIMCAALASCSINKMAVNAVSNALSGSGSAEVFTGDDDPVLVGDALPFAIKMYEALLAQNPGHEGLRVTTGSLCVMYANAFVHGPAEMLDPIDFYEEQAAGKDRAKKLYLRGYGILMEALERKFPGFGAASARDGTLAPLLAECEKEDVPLLYWTVAGGLSALSVDNFDFSLNSKVYDWKAVMERAYELDPDFNNGAIDDFYVLFYGSLTAIIGDNRELAETHFKRALEKSDYKSAGPYVSYATAVCVPAQNYDAYKENLEKALAINPDDAPENRLVNMISQKKAKFLLDNAYIHFSFLPYGGEDNYEEYEE